ncbi:hypothetical protein OSB04_000121 [Centaurea solstitialis]|uniref:Uncharacterized protein n=1 Tax=Centaurea solstitialis TaxID=347529 RepID=A0AA38WRX6_9ASTR|nr:hypothetical protein OSB04_000121 [Centaurea solstitialis]
MAEPDRQGSGSLSNNKMQQEEAKIEDSGSSPSFSCYSSDSLSSMAAAKVIKEEQQQQQEESSRLHGFEESGVNEEDFEFLVLNDDNDQLSPPEYEIDSGSWTVFPVFNRDLKPINSKYDNIVEREINKPKNDEIASITGTLRKLFVDENEDSSSSSYSSSEANELESVPSGTYCVWRPNNNKSDEKITKCKKSNSTGSGSSKRWRIRYLLRRSNSEGKAEEEHNPMLFVTKKMIDSPKQRWNSEEGSRTFSRLKSSPAHEQFYVQKRAENEMVKRRSYLPYRQDLVGLFVNHNNRIGKMLPF